MNALKKIKKCPRCEQLFECKAGNITSCFCYGIVLNATVTAAIAQKYNNCLCKDCLNTLNINNAIHKL